MDFVHLHLHTQYSLADGAILIEKLIPKVKSFGMKSVAITDHGYMYGALDFYDACRKADIKPIMGCEVYISPTTRHKRDYARGETAYYHLILLAENNKGFYNLSKLATIANLEGFYSKPRIDKEALAQYHEGLIALSACMQGEVAFKIIGGDHKAAINAALEYREIMGAENFFLELQHNGFAEQKNVNKQLIKIAEETGIPLVATCDCHYLEKEDHESYEVLTCIQRGKAFDKDAYQKTTPHTMYFKSSEEVSDYFKDCPQAVENTVRIADRCNVSIEFGALHLPFYDVPAPHTSESYFRHLSESGLNERLKTIPSEKHEDYRKRLEMEINVIEMKGYVGYYLIVWDFIDYARKNGITVGPGRGSGAGSLAAYALKITDIDPIKYNLLFERFLNPERPSLPDFDIDFCVRRRDEVLKYLREKYGYDKVSQIVTFSRLSGRSVVNDVSRALAIPLETARRMSEAISETPGASLSKAVYGDQKKGIKGDPSMEAIFKSIPMGADLLRYSLKLEGLLRQAGTHPAGIVIADKPSGEYAPLCRGKNEEVQLQYEAELLEKLGLVKFDLLGLATLTIIDDAIKRIRRHIKPDFDILNIPLDDAEVFEMLSNGESTGVFQLESDGMRNLMKKLRPSALEELIALNALYRPGPMGSGMLDHFCDRKHGAEAITYPMPQLEPVLKETYGIMVYQEQVMEIARIVAGYSLGAADILRRAMGKKDTKEMQLQKKVFIEGDEKLGIPGARKLGVKDVKAREIFSLMESFAEYGFNKSHSAAYAALAYQTAYLRCKYPAHFLAAAMSSEETTSEKIVILIDDVRRIGIDVYSPDINKSGMQFEYVDGVIRFGLQAIKGVGTGAAEMLIAERSANGPYKNIFDLCKRVELRTVNKKVLEALIYAGAFDCFGKKRSQYVEPYVDAVGKSSSVLEKCLELRQRSQKMKEQGMTSLEDFLSPNEEDNEVSAEFPDIEEMSDFELLMREKSALSMFFTSHPIKNAAALSHNIFDTAKALLSKNDKAQIKMLGLVKSVKVKSVKTDKGKMALLTLEDHTGVVEAVAFPPIYEQFGQALKKDEMIVAVGSWDKRKKIDQYSIEINHIYTFAEAVENLTKVNVYLNLKDAKREDADRFYGIVGKNSGAMPLTIFITNGNECEFVFQPAPKFNINPSAEFFRQLNRCGGGFSYRITASEAPQAKRSARNFEEHYINGAIVDEGESS